MIPFYIFIFLISCLILARSSAWIVQSLIKIARFLRWKEFIVASLLMAFVTSLPELFVGISSALHKQPLLSFGNIIGSNIVVLTLIIGMGAIMGGELRFKSKILQKASIYAPLIASLPLLLMLDKKISRIDGCILLIVSFFYFYWLLYQKKRFTKAFPGKSKNKNLRLLPFLKNLGIFITGICLLLLSAEGIVWSVLNLGKEFNLPVLIMGLFLIAIGTSIPEMAFSAKSIAIGHKQMVLGDAMGSIVINSSLVLGVTALITPFEISNFSPYLAGILFTIITSLFFTIFAKTGREITKKEALFLLLTYIAFLISEIFLSKIT